MYYDFNTSNRSFLHTYEILKEKGVSNNKFFLMLKNKELIGIDPYNPNLDDNQKMKVINECKENYWYFLREVVRLKVQGGDTHRFILNLANTASNYCMINNLNIITEVARRNLSVISTLIRITYEVIFHNNSAKIFDMKHSKSRENLYRIIDIICTPDYIKYIPEIKNIDTYGTIKALPCPQTKLAVESLCRANHDERIFFDNFAFIKFNKFMLEKLITSMDMIDGNKPHGIVMNTSLDDLDSEEARDFFAIEQSAVKFHECFYDLDLNKYEFPLILIKYNHKDLRLNDEWYNHICMEMLHREKQIQNEILMNWTFPEKIEYFHNFNPELIKDFT